MDTNVILKKKLSTFLSAKGHLRNVSDEVLYEILLAWENYSGTSKDFYRSIGFSHDQMASIIGKAKKLKRQGNFGEGEFRHVKVNTPSYDPAATSLPIEIVWTNGQIIRFSQVDYLIDFLKKNV